MRIPSYLAFKHRLFIVYPSCSTAVFQTFMCDRQDDLSAYLRVDYEVRCYAPNLGAYEDEYLSMMIYAGVMAIVYPIGTPLLFAAVLYANREALARADELERELMTECESKLTAVKHDELRRQEILEENESRIEEGQRQIRRANFKGGILKLTNGYKLRCPWYPDLGLDPQTT